MQTIRLAITPELNEILQILEEEYKPLSKAEILKLGIHKLLKEIREKKSPLSVSNLPTVQSPTESAGGASQEKA